MITYTNIIERTNVSFEEYLKLEGYSHSFLKHQKNGISEYMKVTDKMKLGTLVDALLTQESQFDFTDPQAEKAQQIAKYIREIFPLMLDRFKSQISYTATMEFSGLKLRTKGRLDWKLEGFAPIDFKVTDAKNDKDFDIISQRFGYPNQIQHYARLGGYKAGYILPYSTKAKRCLGIVKIKVEERNEFWENAILNFGSV